ncbi:MAG TPA: 16S rRNA (adenine(1518)-N(6)/adenine(1519)-N(6))-dimethyltransferase RsmA [Candidatus Hydrogenedentes bacterium]|nr:16S rRNA (adenine(1518)-N(6)/adenine(1519)-N(6))-dimethyltransferase RsmA [Candidatus Hydrogenedentota bacterium]HOL77473.1 16S rRNA (adenine(1518)-N(6)/adenine(1519)-N(6))-dimethyltransferase RsmA [Candidatus Hydrogenedentota bacterium]HPO86280.1 16S rRNA (adenine(1518)-N(6)/adenine(1519)-N(6))-dimethyltransferase RsmA [Candidatus Hydrogenedentota bacterium]
MGVSRLQELCKRYNIRFKKQLGQNLLLDENINRIMVDAADLSKEDHVVEVGAGLGALTEQLQRRAGHVLAVEIDPTFMPCLIEQFGELSHVKLFRGDILNHDLDRLLEEYLPGASSYKMVSNLPYYITTPVLFHFWESPVFFQLIVVMLQQEVAERMTALPDSASYGVLSVATSLYAHADIVHRVPRTCFRPQPEVDSCIVRLRNLPGGRYNDLPPQFVMKVVRAAFSHRRKTLRNTLTRSGIFGAPRLVVEEAAEAAQIDLGRRPQTLHVDEFARLAQEIWQRVSRHTSVSEQANPFEESHPAALTKGNAG